MKLFERKQNGQALVLIALAIQLDTRDVKEALEGMSIQKDAVPKMQRTRQHFQPH